MSLTHTLRRMFLSFSHRRRHPRSRAALVVDWHLFGSAVHRRSSTEDLSPGGAMVSCLQPAPLGSPVVVSLATATGREEIHARVAWARETRMGLRFTSRA